MPYYYGTAMNANSNASANTNTSSLSMFTIAGNRAVIQKIMGGSYVTPADNAIWLRANRTSVISTSGVAITPNPQTVDSPAASAAPKTGVTLGTLVAVPNIQLAFNQRGTAMWAAFNPDEGLSIFGATAPNGEVAIINQCTGTSVNINVNVVHSE